MSLSRRLIFFSLVGVAGFVVDVGMLYLLKGVFGLYLARVASFLCAASATWLLNRAFTFRDRTSGLDPVNEMLRYIALMTVGGGVNYVVYALLIGAFAMASSHPVIGVASGSLAGLVINLVTSRWFLFRQSRSVAT